MPERYHLPTDDVITLPASSTGKDLTKIVKQLLLEDREADEAFTKEISSKKFYFVVNDTFLTLNIHELMLQLDLSNENVLEISYMFALEKPKPKQTIP